MSDHSRRPLPSALSSLLALSLIGPSPLGAYPIVDVDLGIGQEGTAAADIIPVPGPLAASATALAEQLAPVVLIGGGNFDSSATAMAGSSGVDALGGNDSVTVAPTATVDSAATARAKGAAVGGSLAGTANVDVAVAASATALGVDGAGEDDRVTSAGPITTASDARATGVTVALAVDGSLTGGDATAGTAIVEAPTQSTASSVAVQGGAGGDTLVNRASLNAVAAADATAVAAGVSIGVGRDGTLTASAGVSDASSVATAGATGLAGNEGNDTLSNEAGALSLGSTAEATAVGVSLAISGAVSGDVTSGGAVSDSSTTATASVTGLSGGAGADTITSATPVTGGAIADATAVGVSLDVTLAKEGSVSGAALSDASVRGAATAIGIDGGGEGDTITNSGALSLTSDAQATGVAVGLSIAGNVSYKKGEDEQPQPAAADENDSTSKVGSKALSNAATTADATTIGLFGAAGNDAILNTGTLQLLTATSDATGVAASLDLAAGVGINEAAKVDVSGAAVSDVSVTASALAAAVDGGAGNDSVTNQAELTALRAGATATGVAVGLGISGSLAYKGAVEGDVAGEALSKASTLATAQAVALSGGDGDDLVVNEAILRSVVASADATAVAVSLGIHAGLAIEGDAKDVEVSGKAVSDASVTSSATAIGLDGGGGVDVLRNTAGITAILAESNATGVAVSLEIAGTLAYKGEASAKVSGEAVSNTSVNADAVAKGIAAGDGGGSLLNTGNLASVRAVAGATSVGVGLSISGQVAYKEPEDDGGSGDDGASGEQQASATDGSDAEDGIEGSVASDARAVATAQAVGIGGGSGVDTIGSQGGITASAVADATAVAVVLGADFNVGINVEPKGDVSGMALSDASVRGAATAIGIDGGGERDTITNSGALSLTSDAQATGVAVGLTIAGNVSYKKGEEENGGSDDQPQPAAADDGGGDDTPSKVSGQALSKATTTADATAVGILGGAGADTIVNESTGVLQMLAAPNALAEATGVAASLDLAAGVGINTDAKLDVSGAAVSDVSVTASALAAAIEGGAGDDTITNKAAISRLWADATATGVAAALNISGALAYKGDVSGKLGGEAVSDASTHANANAVALAGGEGTDSVVNEAALGEIKATSGAVGVAAALGVSAGLAIEGDAKEVNVSGKAVSDASVTSRATAVALDGGAGDDSVHNKSAITAILAEADATGVAASLNVAGTLSYKGDTESNVSGQAVSNTSVTAEALAIALAGGDGLDEIRNEATIASVISRANAVGVAAALGVSVSVTIEGDAEATVEGGALSNGSVTADATTVGLSGGAADDRIFNTGNLSWLESAADTIGVAAGLNVSAVVTVKGDTTADVTGEALSDTSALATATTTALSGGDGVDRIENSGALNLLAGADATGVAATLDVAGSVTFKGTQEADVKGSAASDASVTARATATGIDGGAGMDTIINDGAITVMNGSDVDAYALGVAASLNVSGSLTIKGVSTGGDVSGVAASDARVTAQATATGIDGGSEDDKITNSATIAVLPAAEALGVSGALNVAFNLTGEADGGAFSVANVSALADATGIAGGTGDDVIVNSGRLELMKQALTDSPIDAKALAVSVSVNFAATLNGDAKGEAFAEARTTAAATATGIGGGAGLDTITNSGAIQGDVSAMADAVSVGASIEVKGATGGAAKGGALTDAGALATATATGIHGGDDEDTIGNTGAVSLTAAAEADATAVSVSLSGGLIGTATGTALADGSARAVSRSTGIDGGTGGDTITSSLQPITTHAGSTSDSLSVAVSIAGTVGVAEGSSVADASARSDAYSAAVDGGAGADTITNASAITSTAGALAEATSTSVTVALGLGQVTNIGTGDSSSIARATATGVEGGSDGDAITNTATIRVGGLAGAEPMAKATSGSTTVKVDIAAGSSEGAATATAASLAEANLLGLSGGAGDDRIDNSGTITLAPGSTGIGLAKAGSSSTTVDVGITVGAATGSTASDTSSTAIANAAAIGGGAGDDWIKNTAALDVARDYGLATATSDSRSVKVGVTLGASLGETSSNSAANALANIAGISGGSGADDVYNFGPITVGKAPPENLSGLMAVAVAGSDSLNLAFGVGGNFQEASSNAASHATSIVAGISAGDGADYLDDAGGIDVHSSAGALTSAKSTKVSLTIGVSGGGASSDASSVSTALAAGIDAGADADEIHARGGITVGASALSTATSKSSDLNILSIGVATQSAQANSSALGQAIGRGVFGGSGGDLIVAGDLEAPGGIKLDVAALSSVLSSSRSSSVTGFSLGSVSQTAQSVAETISHALAVGIDGGEGDDTIQSAARIVAGAVATASTTGVSATNSGFSLGGVSEGEAMSDARATMIAEAVGIHGGVDALAAGESDADSILSVAPIVVSSSASGSSSSRATTSSPVTIFGSAKGSADADASAEVLAKAVGLDGGADGDTITTVQDTVNDGTIDATASATASVTSYASADAAVIFGGASTMGVSDASASIAAEAIGIEGGAGDDAIATGSRITTGAVASGNISATSEVDASVVFGAGSSGAMSDASATKRSTAVGIDAGSGADLVENYGALTASATAGGSVTSTSTAKSKSFFSGASSKAISAASLEGATEAKGIVGGEGGDTIRNYGSVEATADATLTVASLSVATAKSTFGNASAATAAAADAVGSAVSLGIGADAGDDVIETRGTLAATGSATTSITTVSVAIARSTFGNPYTFASSSSIGAATALVDGIDGGEGSDTITVAGLLTVRADADLTLSSLTLSSDGPALSDARAIASADATGVGGGNGDDAIFNENEILVSALPRILAATRTVGGDVRGSVGVDLSANVRGMDGGSGDDTFVNEGDVTVRVGAAHWLPELPAGTPDIALTSITLGGNVNADASAVANVYAAGIDGGEGLDEVLNDATGTVGVAASNFIRMATIEVGANVRADLRSSSAVQVVGIAGEDVANLGSVDAQAASLLKADGAAVTVYGLSLGQTGTAASTVYGVQGDALLGGAFDNLGSITAVSTAEVRSIERVTAFFATGGQKLDFEAGSTAAGVAAGAGDDRLLSYSDGSIDVGAVARGSIQGVTTTYNIFGIGGRTENVVDARLDATAFGLDIGAGSNLIGNAGTIVVQARAIPSDPAVVGANECAPACVARAVSNVSLKETSATATAEANALARGIQGTGDDRVTNSGTLEVAAEAVATSFAQAGEVVPAQDQSEITRLAGLPDNQFIDESLRGLVEADLVGKRLRFPDELDLDFLAATSAVTTLDVAASTVDSVNSSAKNKFVDTGYSGANPVGMRIRFSGVDADFVSLVTAFNSTTGEFTLADDLPSKVTGDSDYTLQVPNQFIDAGFAGANPVGMRIRFPGADGDFLSVVTAYDSASHAFTVRDAIPTDVAVSSGFTLSVLTAEVTAFDSATGKITLSNPLPDEIRRGDTYTFSVVSAMPVGYTFVDDTRIGESIAAGTRVTFPTVPYAYVVSSFSPATGTFTLACATAGCPALQGRLSTYDVYALAVDESNERAGADAQAFATGIDLSGTRAVIVNDGTLDVRATANAATAVNAVIATASAAGVAEARGIRTAVGDDLIENTEKGVIDVQAVVAAASSTGARTERALAVGIDAGGGNDVVINRGTITVSGAAGVAGPSGTGQADVVAIRTGAGNDIVLAGGTITATIPAGTGKALAISTEDGDDHVTLLGGLMTAQDIELGEERDMLLLEAGATFTGVARADPAAPAPPDFDTFVLGGSTDASFELAEIGEEARYRGFDDFRKQGLSTWTLTGVATMDWVVDQGRLAVGATLDGTVETAAGSTGAAVEVLPGAAVRGPDGAAAVLLRGTDGIAVNRGLLTSTGPAVRFDSLAGTTNRLLNDRGGVIESGGSIAIVGGAANDLVGNAGEILGGIVLGDGSNTVENSGRIAGSISGGAGSDYVGNSGDIAGGIALGSGTNGVANSGSIAGSVAGGSGSDHIENSGRILGGITLGDGGNKVENSGWIAGAITGGASNDHVTNTGDIGGDIGLGAGSNSMENWGQIGGWISGGGDNDYVGNAGDIAGGIALGGGSNSVLNVGRVHGTVSGAEGDDAVANYGDMLGGLQLGAGNDDVENYGRIRGAGAAALALGGGEDRLLIAASSAIDGTADGGPGTDTFVLGGATDAAFDLFEIGAKYLGFELFRKEGASLWNVSGVAEGPWTVAEGTLLVNGTLLGDVVVELPGRLGGTGSVGSLVNYGTVAPGNSIGVLGVARDYRHAAGAVLEIEVDGLGNSDRLDVGGAALLEGGTVNVLPAGRFGIATEYTILTAGRGVGGVFDRAVSPVGFLDPDLDYEPNRVLLTLIRNDYSFDSFAETYNQHAVARALDADKKAAARGDFKAVIDEFLALTPSQTRAALDALSGELHATTQDVLLRTGDRFLTTAVERQISAQQVREGGRTVWLDVFGGFGSVDGDGNASGADYRPVGVAGGMDWVVDPNWRLGVALGYSSGTTDLDWDDGGEADAASYHVALYGEYEDGPWSFRGAGAYSRHDVESERLIRYGSVSRRAEADYDADQVSLYLRGGYSLPGPAQSVAQPYLSLAYSRLDRDSFAESGAASLNLRVDDETMESLVATLGVRATWDQEWGKARVQPELRLGWAHQFLDDYGVVAAHLAGAPADRGYKGFRARGVETGRDALVVGAGLTAEVGKNTRLFVSYDAVLNGDRTDHAFVGGLRINW